MSSTCVEHHEWQTTMDHSLLTLFKTRTKVMKLKIELLQDCGFPPNTNLFAYLNYIKYYTLKRNIFILL